MLRCQGLGDCERLVESRGFLGSRGFLESQGLLGSQGFLESQGFLGSPGGLESEGFLGSRGLLVPLCLLECRRLMWLPLCLDPPRFHLSSHCPPTLIRLSFDCPCVILRSHSTTSSLIPS